MDWTRQREAPVRILAKMLPAGNNLVADETMRDARRTAQRVAQREQPGRAGRLARGVLGGSIVVAGAVMIAAVLSGCDPAVQRRIEQSGNPFVALQPPTPSEVALMATNPFDSNQRLRGITMLSSASFGGADAYLRLYRSALGAPPAPAPDEDPGVRAAAALALARHGGPEDAVFIIPLLDEPDARVRVAGARALQRLHNPIAVDALLKRLFMRDESDPDVRAEVATALGQYAQVRVLQSLIGALGDDQLVVTRAANTSLRTLTGQTFADDQRTWISWLREHGETAFAGRTQFIFPAYERDKYWYEYIPFVPPPPVELPGIPVGYGAANVTPSLPSGPGSGPAGAPTSPGGSR